MSDEVTPTPPVVPPVAGSEPAAPSHRDWNQMAQHTRQLNENFGKFLPALESVLSKLVAPPAAAAPAEAPKPVAAPTPAAQPEVELASRLERLERDYAVKNAIVEHGLSGDQRAAFEELAAFAPKDKVAEIAAKIAKLKPSAVAALAAPAVVTPVAPTVAPGTSNTGPSAAAAVPIVPDKITDIPRDVWAALSDEEKLQKYKSQMRGNGRGNPFARARDVARK